MNNSPSNRFSFSKEKLLALSLPEKGQRLTFHDTKIQGLQLRVSASGAKTFCLYRRLKAGEPERITLGKFPMMTVEQARKAATVANAEIEGGGNPAEVKRALKAEPTMNDLFVEYGERHGSKKVSWASDQQRFRLYIQPVAGKYKLSHVTRPMLSKILHDATVAGKAVSTVRQIRALLSVMFSCAMEWHGLPANPAAGLKVSGTPVKRERFLQPSELTRFFEGLAQEPSEIMRDVILMALLTGARIGNVSAMLWRDIDLNTAIWCIPTTKNGTSQMVPLCPEAVVVLKKRDNQLTSDYVFPADSKTGYVSYPKKAFARVLERAGIAYGRNMVDGVTLHDLRRSLGSWQARTGATLVIIGKTLNHKSPQTTAIYARLDIDPVRQAVNTATSAMFEAGGVKQSAEVVEIREVKI